MNIEITNNALAICGKLMNFPLHIDEVKKVLGEARFTKKKHNQIYTWDDVGICGYSKNGQDVESLTMFIEKTAFDFSPNNSFSMTFLVENCSWDDFFHQNVTHRKKVSKFDEGGSLVVGDVSIYYDIEEKEIRSYLNQHNIEVES